MTETSFEFHSPLTLLRQWRDRADQAHLHEVLVTGYTLDLAFFEQHCVSIARGLGARVTLLSDAGQAVHDPIDVRGAGRAYQHGHALCGGAFHPKLVILVGQDDVWAAIGSGNPTASGWGHNAELWVVIRSGRQLGPRALRDLAAWLTALPEFVFMSNWIAATVRQIGDMINPIQIEESGLELTIFGNHNQPILEQLPTAPVKSLGLSAPFFDPNADAVRALMSRLNPDDATVAVQPNLSRFDGESLVSATSSVARVEFRFITEERTYHGKLIEWVGMGGRIALVGSPNLSRAALLTSTDQGGNCELAASHAVPSTLVPPGDVVALNNIQTRCTIPTERTPREVAPLTLLGARRLQGHIDVDLVARTEGTITIETSPTAAPGTWSAGHVIHGGGIGLTTVTFANPEPAGGAVRSRIDVDGASHISSVVFLTDTARCLPRSLDPKSPRLVRDYNLDEVFTDPDLAARFNADLIRLISQLGSHRATVPAVAREASSVEVRLDDDRWGAWMQAVEHTVGPSLAALAFPGGIAPQGRSADYWTVDANTAIDPDEDDTDVDPVSDSWEHSRRITAVTDSSQRRTWRRWAAKLRRSITANPPPPLELRMVVTLLHLDLLAAGVWGPDDDWRDELATVIKALPPSEIELGLTPGLATEAMSTLAAVALAVLFHDARLHGGTEDDLILRSAWNEVSSWAAFAEDKLVDGYLVAPSRSYGRVATRSEVATVVELARESEDDPNAEVRAALDAEGITAEVDGGAFVATVGDQQARRVAARIATLADDPCAVLVCGTQQSCVLLRAGKTLAFADSLSKRWRIFQLSVVGSPWSLLTSADGLPSPRANFPLQPTPEPIETLARAANVNINQLLIEIESR